MPYVPSGSKEILPRENLFVRFHSFDSDECKRRTTFKLQINLDGMRNNNN